jgi:hypothetical protein
MNIMDHDDDDFGGENEDDEDDVSLEDDEFDNERYEVVMRRVVNNDPTLTSMIVGVNGTPNNHWGSLGRAIGMNPQLTELTLRNGLPTDNLELTFLGLAMNRSIQTLIFEYIQLNDNIIDFLSPFLADNQVFRCLKVYLHDRMDIKMNQLCLASFLLMFDYLREFRLHYTGPVENLDIIIQALTVHAGLMKLQLCDITIGRRGYNSLATFFHKSTRLKELSFINMRGITDDGWLDIFTALQITRSKLVRFEITGAEGGRSKCTHRRLSLKCVAAPQHYPQESAFL